MSKEENTVAYYYVDILQRALQDLLKDTDIILTGGFAEDVVFNVNWSALGSVDVHRANVFAADLQRACSYAELINNAELTLDYSIPEPKDRNRMVDIDLCENRLIRGDKLGFWNFMKGNHKERLTETEFSLVSKLTKSTGLNDHLAIRKNNDGTEFWEDLDNKIELSLEEGFKWLNESLSYPVEYASSNHEEAEMLTKCISRFVPDLFSPDLVEAQEEDDIEEER